MRSFVIIILIYNLASVVYSSQFACLNELYFKPTGAYFRLYASDTDFPGSTDGEQLCTAENFGLVTFLGWIESGDIMSNFEEFLIDHRRFCTSVRLGYTSLIGIHFPAPMNPLGQCKQLTSGVSFYHKSKGKWCVEFLERSYKSSCFICVYRKKEAPISVRCHEDQFDLLKSTGNLVVQPTPAPTPTPTNSKSVQAPNQSKLRPQPPTPPHTTTQEVNNSVSPNHSNHAPRTSTAPTPPHTTPKVNDSVSPNHSNHAPNATYISAVIISPPHNGGDQSDTTSSAIQEQPLPETAAVGSATEAITSASAVVQVVSAIAGASLGTISHSIMLIDIIDYSQFAFGLGFLPDTSDTVPPVSHDTSQSNTTLNSSITFPKIRKIPINHEMLNLSASSSWSIGIMGRSGSLLNTAINYWRQSAQWIYNEDLKRFDPDHYRRVERFSYICEAIQVDVHNLYLITLSTYCIACIVSQVCAIIIQLFLDASSKKRTGFRTAAAVAIQWWIRVSQVWYYPLTFTALFHIVTYRLIDRQVWARTLISIVIFSFGFPAIISIGFYSLKSRIEEQNRIVLIALGPLLGQYNNYNRYFDLVLILGKLIAAISLTTIPSVSATAGAFLASTFIEAAIIIIRRPRRGKFENLLMCILYILRMAVVSIYAGSLLAPAMNNGRIKAILARVTVMICLVTYCGFALLAGSKLFNALITILKGKTGKKVDLKVVVNDQLKNIQSNKYLVEIPSTRSGITFFASEEMNSPISQFNSSGVFHSFRSTIKEEGENTSNAQF